MEDLGGDRFAGRDGAVAPAGGNFTTSWSQFNRVRLPRT
jgi:hypothetical protein